MAANDDGKGNDETPNEEEKYWAEHEKRTRGILDRWFEDKKKEAGPGTSRTGGRSTIPKVLADLMGGPFAPEK